MLKLAVIGFGWWGQHVTKRLQGHPSIQVTCVAETDSHLHPAIVAAGVEPVSELEAALARRDVMAVVLTTPHMLHEEQVCTVAAAGRHVFCEKPLAMTATGAARAVAAARSAGVVLGVGHERRFEPGMQRLKAMLAAGDLGTPLHAEVAFSHDKLKDLPIGGWRTSAELSPGAGMTGMGIHLTDLLIWLLGPVATVQAQIRDRVLRWPTGDMVVAQMSHEGGATSHLNAILCTPLSIRLQLYGSDGWVELRNASHPDTAGGVTEWVHMPASGVADHKILPATDSVVANLEAFAEAIAGKAPYPWTDHELIHNIGVYEAIVASAHSNKTISPRTLGANLGVSL